MRIDIELKQWRGANDLGRGAITQAQAAEFIGVPYRTYQDWEYGRSAPTGLALQMLMQKLGRKKPKPEDRIAARNKPKPPEEGEVMSSETHVQLQKELDSKIRREERKKKHGTRHSNQNDS